MPTRKRDATPPSVAVRDTKPEAAQLEAPQVLPLDSTVHRPDAKERSNLTPLKAVRSHQRPVIKDHSVDPAQSSPKRQIVVESWPVSIELVDASKRKVIGSPIIHASLDPETRLIVGYSVSIRPHAGAE
jgi:hypothetical protein